VVKDVLNYKSLLWPHTEPEREVCLCCKFDYYVMIGFVIRLRGHRTILCAWYGDGVVFSNRCFNCLRRLMPLFTDPFYFDSSKT
jgi:hypothetical protein